MHAKKVEFLQNIAARWPNPKCELVYHTPFQLLIAVMLSAQTTDKAVNKALSVVWKSCNEFGPSDLLQMGEKKFLEHIKSIGLAPTKAMRAVMCAQIILEQHDGKIPLNREQLEQLPGVGRKTANVILGVLGIGEPVVAVDTHVERVARRLGVVSQAASLLDIEKKLLALAPDLIKRQLHLMFVLHGRYICVARKPKCHECPVLGCPSREKE